MDDGPHPGDPVLGAIQGKLRHPPRRDLELGGILKAKAGVRGEDGPRHPGEVPSGRAWENARAYDKV